MRADISMQRKDTTHDLLESLPVSHTVPHIFGIERLPTYARPYRMKIRAYMESSQRGEGKRFIDETLAHAGLPLTPCMLDIAAARRPGKQRAR
jgi:hypothetical protein